MRLALTLCLFVLGAATAVEAAPACPTVEIALVRAKASPETRPVRWKAQTIQVDRTPIITLDDIVDARWGDSDSLQAEDLQLKFRDEPAERLFAATSDPKGVRLAVILNGRVELNTYFSGGYGIGREGLQLSPGEPEAFKDLPETIARCSKGMAGR